jgi:DNA-binding transcriptional LysR family regulator
MRFKNLDLNLLVVLDALLTEGSVTRAARVLHRSPSAISDALGRLREYFDDELLAPVGRQLQPTPRAESLKAMVRDILVRIETSVTVQPTFDPAATDRRFRIHVSDFTQFVLGPAVMAQTARARSKAILHFLPQAVHPHRDLERGDADLLILPAGRVSPEHPGEALFTERFACVVWRHGPLADGPWDTARYAAASHVVMRPISAQDDSAYEDTHLRRAGVERRIAATTFGFATLPSLVVGTGHVATMQASLARQLSRLWPLTLRPCPIEIPPMAQVMQWHSYRARDPGLAWLRQVMHHAAAGLTEGAAPAHAD